MEWMFARLFEMKRKYDAVAIFDADNLVDKRFLLEMNNRLCKGDKLVQGYLDAKILMIHGFPELLPLPFGLLTISGI